MAATTASAQIQYNAVEKDIEAVTQEKNIGNLKLKRAITLEWKNIQYSVPKPDGAGEMKALLQSMSGSAKPGELLGIMGTSG